MRDQNLGLGQRIDGARAQLWNPLGARVALVNRRGGQELLLGGFVQMRDLDQSHCVTCFTARASSFSGSRKDFTTSDMPARGVKVV
jgi:hypothetical protein